MIFLIILFVILIISLGLQGLVYWGVGAFICWAFQIPFEFTFAHGIAIAFIVSTLISIFNRDKIK